MLSSDTRAADPPAQYLSLIHIYDAEQKHLEEEARSIQQEIEVQEKQIENIEKFVQKAHKYVHIEELTPYACLLYTSRCV